MFATWRLQTKPHTWTKPLRCKRRSREGRGLKIEISFPSESQRGSSEDIRGQPKDPAFPGGLPLTSRNGSQSRGVIPSCAHSPLSGQKAGRRRTWALSRPPVGSSGCRGHAPRDTRDTPRPRPPRLETPESSPGSPVDGVGRRRSPRRIRTPWPGPEPSPRSSSTNAPARARVSRPLRGNAQAPPVPQLRPSARDPEPRRRRSSRPGSSRAQGRGVDARGGVGRCRAQRVRPANFSRRPPLRVSRAPGAPPESAASSFGPWQCVRASLGGPASPRPS